MQKVSSFSIMLMGIGFLVLAYFLDNNVYLRSILLIASIVLNIIAIINSFKEKKENKH